MAKGKKKQNARAAREAERAKKAKRDQLVLGMVVIVAVIGLVTAVALFGGDDPGTTTSGGWDLPALDEELDPGVDGRFELASYAGTPLVVNFFASWCVSCENELPRFRDSKLVYGDDLEVVFVNSNETGDWRPMAERTGIIDLPLIRDINGSNGNGLYRSLGGSGGMPMTAFYSPDGQLVHVDLGELSSEALQSRLTQFYGLSRS